MFSIQNVLPYLPKRDRKTLFEYRLNLLLLHSVFRIDDSSEDTLDRNDYERLDGHSDCDWTSLACLHTPSPSQGRQSSNHDV